MPHIFEIGREELTEEQKAMMQGNLRYRLAIKENGNTIFYGNPGSVPKSVSRHHCTLEVDDNLVMTLTNVSGNNLMTVNGDDCLKKKGVQLRDEVTLGKDKYPLKLEEIVKGVYSKQKYDISHLRNVYDDFEKEKIEMQIKNARFQNYSTISGFIIPLSIVVGTALPENAPKFIRSLFYIASLIFLGVFFILRHKRAEVGPYKQKELTDKFNDTYVCPNPACGHFLGNQPYRNILKAGSCPYCKAKFEDKSPDSLE